MLSAALRMSLRIGAKGASGYDSAESTAALLNGHLYGAVLRSGGRRDEAHLFHMEVRGVDSYGKGAGQVLFRWALPAPEVTDGGT